MSKVRAKSSAAREDVGALLRGAGLRATGARVAVFELLKKAKSPVSHGEAADAVAEHGFDRATIYRNLIDLADAGFVVRTDLGDHVWRFALKDGRGVHGVHPHFTCTDCGTVECLPEVDVKVTARGKAPKAVAKDVEVQLKGRCDECH